MIRVIFFAPFVDIFGAEKSTAAAQRLRADGEALLAEQPWWRRLLRLLVWRAALADGWGDPVAGLRADLSGHEAAAAGDHLTAGDEALARACRDLLRRFYVNGEGTESLAADLRLTRGTVKVNLFKCRQRALEAYRNIMGRS